MRFRNPTDKAAAIALSSRFSKLLPPALQSDVQDLLRKHQVENIIPESDLKSQALLDKFEANSSAYFKDLRSKLDAFFESSEGQTLRASLQERGKTLDQESDGRELEAYLKIFADEDRTGIERYISRATLSDNPTHSLGVPGVDESLFETEILLPTNRDLKVEGLAESFLIGITPVQIISRPRMADNQWMDSYLFANHDGFHRFLAARGSQVNREILGLPLEERLAILTEIDQLPSPERRSLAQTALYLTV